MKARHQEEKKRNICKAKRHEEEQMLFRVFCCGKEVTFNLDVFKKRNKKIDTHHIHKYNKHKQKIKELMEIPRCLDTYVNDYQMHVFEVEWLTEEQISHFHSDFKVVANFFVQKRKNRDYIPDDPTEIRHVDEVLKLLKVMTGDRRYEEIFRKKKGVRSMCDVAERLEKMGIAKGIEIGRSEGKMEGEIKGKMLVYKNLCREGFGEEEARRLTELPEDMSLEQ